MSQHHPRIRIHVRPDGVLILRESLKICFYMRRSQREIAQDVMRSLETFLRAVGPQSLSWYLDLEGHYQNLTPESWADLRHNLAGSHWSRIVLTADPPLASTFQFEFYCMSLGEHFDPDPPLVSAVGFCLPTEFLETHGPSRVRELALELAAPLPFDSGHAGLFFHGPLEYPKTDEHLSQLCLRYPGMDIGEVESIATGLNGRVKGPSWLTFLGQPVLGELGGAEGLRTRLSSPGTTVQQLDGERAVITLGTWPEAGDTEAGRNLPEYRELARVLGPHLYHPREYRPPFIPEDIWQRWERRFLD